MERLEQTAEIRRLRMLKAAKQRAHPTALELARNAAGIKGKEASELWTYPIVAKRRGQ